MGATSGPPHPHRTRPNVESDVRCANSPFFFNSARFGTKPADWLRFGPIPTETRAKMDDTVWFRLKQTNKTRFWPIRLPKQAKMGRWPPFFCFMWPWERERERGKKKRWEDTKKLLELRRGDEEEYRLITKEYKLRRWESYLFHVGGLGNWKMSKETFLEGGFLFTITKNIDFIKNKS